MPWPSSTPSSRRPPPEPAVACGVDGTSRPRRPAQLREVQPVQRPHRRPTPSWRAHPFSTTETTVGIAQVPDQRLDQLAEMCESRARSCRPACEFVDIAGPGQGGQHGRGPRQPVPRPAPRGRRPRLRAAGLRGPTSCRPGRPRPASTTSHARARARAGRPGHGRGPASTSRRKAAKGDKSLAGRDRRPGAGPGLPRRGHAALPGRLTADERGPAQGARSCSPTSRCWPWSTSARTSSTTPSSSRSPAVRRPGRRLGVSRAAGGRGGPARSRGAGRAARGPRARRGRRAPGGPGRLPPAGPAHVPHHRATRRAGPGRSGPAPRRRSAPA